MPIHRRAVLAAPVVLAACVARKDDAQPPDFLVFFTAQSAALDGPATEIVRQAAAAAQAAPSEPVIISGYADRIGTPQANQILSRLRAQVVADGLVERGVARSRIRLRPRGATGGDPGVESRRVEILIGS